MDRAQREADLRHRILGGDTSAWDEWYAESFDALWVHVARRIGPDRSRVEDIVQESWLIAVRRLESFDPARGSFRGWLHGIAEHVARNATRRRRRRDRLRRPLDETEVAAPVRDDPDARELLETSLAGLPDHYRAVLRAKYVEELSVEEIAARRDATPKAVESLLGRARGAFREIYAIFASQPPRPLAAHEEPNRSPGPGRKEP